MSVVDLHELADRELAAQGAFRTHVYCCGSTACLAAGADAAREAIETVVQEQGLETDVRVVPTGCMGMCSHGPLVKVRTRGSEDVLYANVDAAAAQRVAESHVVGGKPVPEGRISFRDPFFALQTRVVLENMGEMDPNRIEVVRRPQRLPRARARRDGDDAGRGGRGDPP